MSLAVGIALVLAGGELDDTTCFEEVRKWGLALELPLRLLLLLELSVRERLSESLPLGSTILRFCLS